MRANHATHSQTLKVTPARSSFLEWSLARPSLLFGSQHETTAPFLDLVRKLVGSLPSRPNAHLPSIRFKIVPGFPCILSTQFLASFAGSVSECSRLPGRRSRGRSERCLRRPTAAGRASYRPVRRGCGCGRRRGRSSPAGRRPPLLRAPGPPCAGSPTPGPCCSSCCRSAGRGGPGAQSAGPRSTSAADPCLRGGD
ncbi:unnamed protein product [Ixodes pacificus]